MQINDYKRYTAYSECYGKYILVGFLSKRNSTKVSFYPDSRNALLFLKRSIVVLLEQVPVCNR